MYQCVCNCLDQSLWEAKSYSDEREVSYVLPVPMDYWFIKYMKVTTDPYLEPSDSNSRSQTLLL